MHDFFAQKRQALAEALRRHTAAEVRFDASTRHVYATDASIYRIEPLGVVLPRTADDLVAVVQLAAETRTPLVPRGGGTSLSGQSIGPGLVVDCSKYLNAVGPVDVAGRTVRVQPGVVLDHLNRALAPHGLQFGPDVATADRATLGGMIGNNSAGSRSVVYGKTIDHVRALRAVLADGSAHEFGRVPEREWRRRAERDTLEGQIYREARRVLDQNADEVRRRFPDIIRRVSGYNLLDALGAESLVPLLVGSEGTLAVVAEAELGLVPRPRHRGLLVPHFASLAAALDALDACLELAPSAVELLDSMLIELARRQRSLKETMAAVRGTPAALLMVEFSGDSAAEVSARVHELERRLRGVNGLTAAVPALEANVRDPLWSLRSSAVPLLYGLPGDRKPVTFVEDCAVAPARLPEFAARFRELLRRHGTDGAFYGHASVGCLHIRPLLDLKDSGDVRRMRAIMADVTDLVLEFGGSLSGEHGDGLVRGEWNKKMFGPQVYEAFRQIKRAFDPENLLNPGKVVDSPSMLENLRLGPEYQPRPTETVFDYSAQGGFFRSIELCNGAGVCRKTQGGAMCPSYRATRDERDTTRARANALRVALDVGAGVTQAGAEPLAERWVHEVMDLCLSCKACKSECPSNVDLAKLKAEFLHAYHRKRLRPPGHYLLANIHRLNRLGAPLAGVLNWLNRRGLTRLILEKVAGIDRRRSLPELHADHVRRWFAGRPPRQGGRKVLLFDDCFTTFNEPRIGRAAVEVMEAAGCEVELVNPICCGRALLSKGFLKEARALAADQLPDLARRVADGTPILGLEPSCVLTLADEWPELVPGPAARKVAAAVRLADQWLAEETKAGTAALPLAKRPARCVFHGHCHQRALVGVGGSAEALRLVPGLEVTALDAGCCGMAGAFGFEKRHYDVSVKIANLELVPALKAEPEALVAATGTSCRHQIRDLTGREALHPLEVIREALGGQ
jgi:FAD/FMN-containing dehydrogenase/Fe-S oxidoreductase